MCPRHQEHTPQVTGVCACAHACMSLDARSMASFAWLGMCTSMHACVCATAHQSPSVCATAHQSPGVCATAHQSPGACATAHQSPGVCATAHQSPCVCVLQPTWSKISHNLSSSRGDTLTARARHACVRHSGSSGATWSNTMLAYMRAIPIMSCSAMLLYASSSWSSSLHSCATWVWGGLS